MFDRRRHNLSAVRCGCFFAKGPRGRAPFDTTRFFAVEANRERFFQSLNIRPTSVVQPKQVHGNRVVVVDQLHKKKSEADGLLTNRTNIILSITVADCLPIFLFDPGHSAVGLLHGGWRSLVLGIVSTAVGTMSDKFGSRPKKLLVGIGPGISRCHFVVGVDVAKRFRAYPQAFAKVGEQPAIDLKRIAALQCMELGVRAEHIEIHPDCTACLPQKYFSFRRDRPAVVEAMVAVIGLR